MNPRTIGLFMVVATVATLVPLSPAQINYPSFASTAGMVLNGTATQSGNVLELNPATGFAVGTAWFQTQQPVTGGFVTTFAFRMSPAGADGMTFIIHNDAAGTGAIAQAGGSLGWTSEPLVAANTMINLLVIELDTWQNGNFGDPDNNHISVHLVPTLPTTVNGADEFYSIGRVTPPFTMADGQIHTLCITYTPGTLELFLDGSITPTLSIPFDFATGAMNLTGTQLAGLNLPNGTAYMGFTGATGGALQTNEVFAWTMGGAGPCGTLAGPYETNNAVSSLDFDGAQGTSFVPAITAGCVGGTFTANSSATVAAPFDILYALDSIISGFPTPAGQRVNINLASPSLANVNGGGLFLNLVPHPGTFVLPLTIAFPVTLSAQQVVADVTHPDTFQLSQAPELSTVAAAAILLTLGDDNFVEVPFAAPLCAPMSSFSFYGTAYTSIFVNSNGSVGFGSGDGDFTATVPEFQNGSPRAAGLWTDLSPNAGGSVTVSSSALGVTVSFLGVPQFGTGNSNSFDILLDIAGQTSISNYAAPALTVASIVGLTPGGGATDPTGGLGLSWDALAGSGPQAGLAT
ncbi:MAG: hypothetical protein CMJ83_18705, partial [Planctomycetes bacterium]|nr:hypothetical protein [Planctomycetota bacterium]